MMKYLWWAIICLGLVPVDVLGITGGEIIAEVKERLSDYKTFSARFHKQSLLCSVSYAIFFMLGFISYFHC